MLTLAICDVGCRLMLAPAALDCWNFDRRAMYVSASLLPLPSLTDLHRSRGKPSRNARPPRHALEARRRQLPMQGLRHGITLTARTGSWQAASATQSIETMRGRVRGSSGGRGSRGGQGDSPTHTAPGGSGGGVGRLTGGRGGRRRGCQRRGARRRRTPAPPRTPG